MLSIVDDLGDERVNLRPDLPGANSPYVIVHHCVQVTHWWVGLMCAGREMDRDRPAEFVGRGSVAELHAQVTALRGVLVADVAAIESHAPILHPERLRDDSPMRGWTRGEALIHAYEELAQHLGHLEITRDILLSR
jgi:hypothetical protein